MSVRRIALTEVGEIADLFFNSAVVAIPTDTVYGVAASLASPTAVARLFTLKDRPVTTPLPVMVAELADLLALGATVDDRTRLLAGRFWPGPLTMVVPAPTGIAEAVGATASVGFRIPADDAVRAVLRATGPLCVTSANVHGADPCTHASEVITAFGDSPDLDAVVDGGLRNGAVSTVVDLSCDPFRVLRAGAIGERQIAEALGESSS